MKQQNLHHEKKGERMAATAASLIGNHSSQPAREAVEALKVTRLAIKEVNAQFGAVSVDKRAGLVFEEFHAGTFNSNAARAGKTTLKASTGKLGGFVNDQQVDIRVTEGARTVAEVQAKCCGTSARSAVAVAKPKYQGTQRVIPADQVEEASSALRRSAAGKAKSANPRMRAIGEARQEAAGRISARVEANGVTSEPLTHAEAKELAAGNLQKLDDMVSHQATKAALAEIGQSAASGAIISAGFGFVMSAMSVAKGERKLQDAAVDLAGQTAGAAARSAATTGVAQVVRSSATATLGKSAGAFVRGSAPVAVAGAIVEMGIDACKGELTSEKAVKTTARAACGWAGAEGGAALGTLVCPGVGTLIGGVVGGILGASWI